MHPLLFFIWVCSEPLLQGEDIFTLDALVAHLVHDLADEEDAEAAYLALIGREGDVDKIEIEGHIGGKCKDFAHLLDEGISLESTDEDLIREILFTCETSPFRKNTFIFAEK